MAVTQESQANQSLAVFPSTPDMVQPILNFVPGSASGTNAVITVDSTGGAQQFDGWGSDWGDLTINLMANPAASTNPSANLPPMTAAQQTAFLKSLFAPTTGYDPTAGYGMTNILIPIGANSQVYRGCWNNPTGSLGGSCGSVDEGTYDDNNGQVDNCLVNGGAPLISLATQCNFNIAGSYDSNLPYQIPSIQSILQINPGMHIIGSATYIPNWLMAPDPDVCGTDQYSTGLTITTLNPTYYQAAANYYTKFVQTYESYKIPIWALTVMNEPCIPAGTQPGNLSGADAVVLQRDYIAPTFKAAKLDTQLLPEVNGYPVNGQTTNYPQTLMQDPILAPELLGVAWHGYNGYPAVEVVAADSTVTQTNGNQVHVNQYQTEYGGPASTQIASSFDFRALQPLEGLRYGLKNWMWNSTANNAADNAGFCNGNGTGSCLPLMTIDGAGNVTPVGQPSYIMKQYSRYIHPGAYIVSSTEANSIYSVAARNPDGSNVLVVVNYDETDPTRSIGVNWGGRTFSYTMPLYSMATFLWPGIQNATNTEIDDAAQGTGTNQLAYAGSGWTHGTSCGAYAGCNATTLATTSTQGNSVSMSFQGSYVNVYGGVAPGGGTASISIDNGPATMIDEAAPTVQGNPAVFTMPAGNALIYSTPLYAPLAGGTHVLQITTTSSAPFVLDRVELVTPTTTTVDDSSQGSGAYQFNYTGSGWNHCTNCDASPGIGKYLGSSSTDSTSGDSFTFTYTGTSITLYTATGPANGYFNVSYDGSPAVKIDTYSNNALGNQVGWVSPAGTTSAQHTVAVTVTGTHGAYSSGNAVTFDRAEIVSASGVALALSPGSVTLAAGASGASTLTITPVGGFTGAVTLLCTSPIAYITCSASAPAAIVGTAPSTSTITVSVAATAELRLPAIGSNRRQTLVAFALPFGSLGLLLCVRRRKHLVPGIRLLVLLLMAGSLMSTLSGCGGKSTPAASGPSLPPAGNQTMTITATTASGTFSTTLIVAVSN